MNKSKLSILGIGFLALSLTIFACSKADDSGTDITSVVEANYTNGVTVSTSDGFITITSTGTPEHVSAYWGAGHALYEANPTGVNPGIIRERTNIMTIPVNPTAASSKEVTALGAIGMALNGVPIFNDREGGNVPLDSMVLEHFERAGGHVGPSGYHYHVSGDFTTKDDAKLVGFIRDGFPLYGRQEEDGSYPTDLDENGGHFGPTADFPDGIYHYHCSNTNYLGLGVYVLKAGSYHGTKGTYVQ
jgi:hypothetical protein